MFGFIVTLLMVVKSTIEELSDNIKIALESDLERLTRNLNNLNIDIAKLECVCCNGKIKNDYSNLGGICKHNKEIFSYCSKLECELKANLRFAS